MQPKTLFDSWAAARRLGVSDTVFRAMTDGVAPAAYLSDRDTGPNELWSEDQINSLTMPDVVLPGYCRVNDLTSYDWLVEVTFSHDYESQITSSHKMMAMYPWQARRNSEAWAYVADNFHAVKHLILAEIPTPGKL